MGLIPAHYSHLIMGREAEVKELSDAFSALVRGELSDHLDEIVRLNRENDALHSNMCATHDFCDANEIMAEAFTEVLGREVDAGNDVDAALWSAAWNLSVRREFADVEEG